MGQKLRALLKLCLMRRPLLSTLSYYRHTEDMIVTPFAQVSPLKPPQLATGGEDSLPDGQIKKTLQAC